MGIRESFRGYRQRIKAVKEARPAFDEWDNWRRGMTPQGETKYILQAAEKYVGRVAMVTNIRGWQIDERQRVDEISKVLAERVQTEAIVVESLNKPISLASDVCNGIIEFNKDKKTKTKLYEISEHTPTKYDHRAQGPLFEAINPWLIDYYSSLEQAEGVYGVVLVNRAEHHSTYAEEYFGRSLEVGYVAYVSAVEFVDSTKFGLSYREMLGGEAIVLAYANAEENKVRWEKLT